MIGEFKVSIIANPWILWWECARASWLHLCHRRKREHPDNFKNWFKLEQQRNVEVTRKRELRLVGIRLSVSYM